jgi:hypothetical protein
MNDREKTSLSVALPPADPTWTTTSVEGPFTLLSEPWTSEENTTLLRPEKVTTLHALLGTVTPGITTHRVSGSICLAKQIPTGIALIDRYESKAPEYPVTVPSIILHTIGSQGKYTRRRFNSANIDVQTYNWPKTTYCLRHVLPPVCNVD